MPLPRYTRLHPEAIVTPNQLAVLRDYLLSAAPDTLTAQSKVEAADSQYRQLIATAGKPLSVRDAPNGIAFLPDYRIDTKTLRLIIGNDIAIKAIADNKIRALGPMARCLLKWRGAGRPANTALSRQASFQVALMVKNAKTSGGRNYPAGSVLSLVTWRRQEDSRWFGAKIPAQPKSVEVVTVAVSGDGRTTYEYQDLKGAP